MVLHNINKFIALIKTDKVNEQWNINFSKPMDDKSVHVKFCLYFYNQFFVSENMIIFLECIKFFGGDFRRGGVGMGFFKG